MRQKNPEDMQLLRRLKYSPIKLHLPIICIILCFLLIEGFLYYSHSVPFIRSETDGIGYMERATGSLFQLAPFHGPGYSFAIRLVTMLGFDTFSSAKMVSIFFGLVFVFVSYLILLNLSTRRVAIVAAIIIALNYSVIISSIMVISDMMAASLFLASLALLILPKDSKIWKSFFAGLLGGLSYLTRHPYILIAVIPFIQLLFEKDGNKRKKDFINIVFFFLGFVLIISPWCIFLYQVKGNPFWNQHHLNLAFSMYRGNQGWNAFPSEQQFSNLTEVILSNPRLFIMNLLRNLVQLPWKLITFLSWVGIFGGFGFFVWAKHLTSQKLSFLVACLLYGFVINLTWFDPRYYLPLVPLFSLSITYGLFLIPERISFSHLSGKMGRIIRYIPLRKTMLILSIVFLAYYSDKKIKLYFHDHSFEYLRSAKKLESYHLENVSLLTSKPHIPYFLNLDKYKVKCIDYRSEKIRLQSAKVEQFPEILRQVQPTYFIYDERYSGEEFPHFRIFLDPSKNPYPQLLEFVFQIDNPYRVVVYRYKKKQE